jgi:hypothetical protein
VSIVSSTKAYEGWMASRVTVVRPDVALKHQRMRESPFVFLRGTFYRWIELLPEVCAEVMDAPRVLAIGDLHIENFGTWRDHEGRLVWGVNDLDEAASLPYVNDLVRLATSAALATRTTRLRLSVGGICDALLDGYLASLHSGGEPIVLSERHVWLRDLAGSESRDPKKFWKAMQSLRPVRSAPRVVAQVLRATVPDAASGETVRRRVAGVGSLGRPRFVLVMEHEGGWLAREAKAWLPSAAARGETSPRAALTLVDRGVRCRDPFWSIQQSWIIRRLAPDCARIEVEDLPERWDERKLLRAMGWETANLHLATTAARREIVRDVHRRRGRWLAQAVESMLDATVRDWKTWRRLS